MNPTFAPPPAPSAGVDRSPAAVAGLAGKRLAILENGWPTWRRMLDDFVARLHDRHPGLEVTQYSIPRGYAAPEALLQEVAQGSDCAVVGLANCGSCTAWSFHDSVELLGAGVPTVWVVSNEFVNLGAAIMKSRHADVPVVTLPANPEMVPEDEALAMMREHADAIVAALMGDGATTLGDAPDDPGERHVEAAADDDELFGDLYERGWTDGLPVIAPTPERVAAFLALAGDVHPLTVVADLPPRYRPVTYENLAANAVMAGCRPEYLPVLLAQVRAAATPRFNLNGIATTTGPTAPLTIVNGPVRKQLDVNAGRGLFGPGWRANATIGRALRLLMANVGGAIPGEVSKAVMGTPGRYTFCIGENEEESPWTPLHVDRGLERGDSAVTLMGIMSTINVTTVWGADPADHLTTLGSALAYMGSNNVLMGRGTVLVVLTPGQARQFADAGYSKADVADAIWRAAAIPVERFPPTVRPQPPNVWLEEDGVVHAVAAPENVLVVVAGGPEAHYAHVLPSHPSVVPVTERIEPLS